jgi:hypothetical protein
MVKLVIMEMQFSVLGKNKKGNGGNNFARKLPIRSILCIENNKIRSLAFDDIIHESSHLKS